MAKTKEQKPIVKKAVTFQIDEEVEKGFAQLSEDIGIPMDTLLASMMQQAVRKQEVKLTSLDVNGFTPKEAAELLRRYREMKEAREKALWEEMIRESGQDKIDKELGIVRPERFAS